MPDEINRMKRSAAFEFMKNGFLRQESPRNRLACPGTACQRDRVKVPTIGRPRGSSSLGCLGYLCVIGLLVVGCQGLYVAWKNHEPLEITVADYIAQKPDAEWLTLKEGKVSLLEAAYKARMGNVSEIFVPVRPAGESTDKPIHILLSTDDKAVVRALEELSKPGGNPRRQADAAAQQAEKLFVQKNITALARHEMFSDFVTHTRLSWLSLNLADDFIILDHDAAPEPAVSLAMVSGGLLIWLFMLAQILRDAVWRWRRRRAFHRQNAGQ
jgi:hypothetical protein